MLVKTAFEANVLLTDETTGLKSKPITLHVPMDIALTKDQLRAKLFEEVEKHYRTHGRVVSLMLAEQAEFGKVIVSLRRDPKAADGRLESYSVPKIEPSFRLGGDVITVSFGDTALH